MRPVAHFVFGTTASFSHAPPVCNLALSLLTHSQDLCVSIILHANNLAFCSALAADHPEDVRNRLKLVTCGEETSKKNEGEIYMTMVTKSGEAYAGVLMNKDWPRPNVFIFDITSFFYVQVKAAVEAKLKLENPPKLVGYHPELVGELLLYAGSKENGSLRWVADALDRFDPEARDIQKRDHSIATAASQGKSPADIAPKGELLARLVKAYETEVTNSDRELRIPGYPLMLLRERWPFNVDWNSMIEPYWFDYLAGVQAVAPLPVGYITCLPSDILEPDALELCRQDTKIGRGEQGGFVKVMGWFENKPGKGWEADELKVWLDGKGAKEVVYIAFGTIVNAGEGLPVLFSYLEENKMPFIYACGSQKDSLPADVRSTLDKAEERGLAMSPEWVDQVGVLSHPSVLCFVSHSGVNSVIEGILAGVPIICWARRWDQIFTSSLLHSRSLAYNLLQQRSGHALGKEVPSRPGEVVMGTRKAMRDELHKAFGVMRGDEGEEMRGRLRGIAGEMREKRKGVWDEAVGEFARWARDS